MLTFLILGIVLVMAIVVAALIFVMSGRGKSVPSGGSHVTHPAQGRATGRGDN